MMKTFQLLLALLPASAVLADTQTNLAAPATRAIATPGYVQAPMTSPVARPALVGATLQPASLAHPAAVSTTSQAVAIAHPAAISATAQPRPLAQTTVAQRPATPQARPVAPQQRRPAAKKPVAQQQEGNWISPLWRSALVPGWGQGYNNQPVKGWILGVATVGLFAGTVVTYYQADAAEKEYMDVPAGKDQGTYDNAYNKWDRAANLNHGLYIAFGVAYAYTLIDAIWNGKTASSTALRDQPLTLAATPQGGWQMDYKVMRF